jgi:hypothetical protein
MDRPTLFLSSTVHDFGDLRSALKDYLELKGCRVLASEFTDFTRPLDKHSYDACLATIDQADIFVLFIGRRVGGWIDEPNKISITRAEYRHAYQLAQAGKIRILCFVRSEVWDHRQSVRDLASAIKSDGSLTEHQRRKFVNYPNTAMEDATAIISFIDEVAKNNETAAAAKGLGPAPIANWIWAFSTFTQVRQALDPLVLSGRAVRDATGRKALQEQLLTMLQSIVPRFSKGPFNPIAGVVNLVNDLGLDSSNYIGTLTIAEKTWNRLVFLEVLAMGARIDPSPLQAHLSSGLLLEYDPTAGAFRNTEEFDLLVKVIDLARDLGGARASGSADLLKHGQAADASGNRRVPSHLVVEWAHRLLRWVDLMQTARTLARSLAGKPTKPLQPVPASPILDQNPMLAAEAVTMDEVRHFVLD